MTTDNRLPAKTRLGTVALDVADIAGSLSFYQERLGMQLLEDTNDQYVLGAGETPLLRLFYRPDAPPRPAGTSGLYHFALLFLTRAYLAAMLWRLAAQNTRFQGFSDHLVSEAIYLADPEGNGIELYRDRPRAEWPYKGNTLQMATLPLDTDDLLTEASSPAAAMAAGTTMGHIHLHVGDLARAVAFYQDIVGFDLMLRYGPSAAFLSAGGYHHHLGLNTWAGPNAPAAPSGSRGLRSFEIVVPEETAVSALLERVQMSGYAVERADNVFVIAEPSGARLRVIHSNQEETQPAP
jgi:catechol 2,3-dioxygenase